MRLNAQSRNALANYAGRIVNIVSAFIFIPLYVKILGLEAYGIVAFLVSLLSLTALFDLGITATFMRKAAIDIERREFFDNLATYGRVLALTTGILSVLLFFGAESIAVRWLNPSNQAGTHTITMCLQLFALSLIPHFQFQLIINGLMGQQRQLTANLLLSAYNLVRSGGVLLPLLLWPDVVTFAIWQCGAAVIFFMLARVVVAKLHNAEIFSSGQFSLPNLLSSLNFTGGMFAISVIALVNTQLDKLIVSKVFSITEFSHYSLAATLAQIPLTATTPFAAAMYPLMMRLQSQDKPRELAAAFGQFLCIVAYIAAMMSFSVGLFRGELLHIWLAGEQLGSATENILLVIVAGNFFLCLSSAPYYLLLAHSHTRAVVIIASCTLLLSVPLTAWSVSHFGLIGAAYPWLLLNALNFAFVMIAVRMYCTPNGIKMYGLCAKSIMLVVAAVLPILLARLVSEKFALEDLSKVLVASCACILGVATTYRMGLFRNPKS